MKRPNLDAARDFLAECQRREISVTPNRDDWRLHLWGPTQNSEWVQANHHLKADVLTLLTGSPDLYLGADDGL
jgi:hypothetical protein